MATDWRRLPHLPRENDERDPFGQYRRDLNRALAEKWREDAATFDALGRGTVLIVQLSADYTITANVAWVIPFDVVVRDTLGGWNAVIDQYVPKRAGLYRCSWSVVLHDSGAIATSTLAYALLKPGDYQSMSYGNGAAWDVPVQGSAIVECNGIDDAIYVEAYLQAGSAPVVFGTGALRTWLAVDYLGT